MTGKIKTLTVHYKHLLLFTDQLCSALVAVVMCVHSFLVQLGVIIDISDAYIFVTTTIV